MDGCPLWPFSASSIGAAATPRPRRNDDRKDAQMEPTTDRDQETGAAATAGEQLELFTAAELGQL